MFKKTLLGAIVAAGSLMSLVPTAANAQYTAIVSTAPPPPVQEAVPAPRSGYVWAPGYWNYRHHRHAWVRGHWVHGRRGHHYVAAHWEQRGHRWHFEQGHWD